MCTGNNHDETMKTLITEIPGIGPAMAIVLAKHGFHTAEDVASSDMKSLCAVPGLGSVKGNTILSAAKNLTATGQKEPKKTKKKKDKSKSKTKADKNGKKKKSGKKKDNGKKKGKDGKKKSGKKGKSKKGSKKKK